MSLLRAPEEALEWMRTVKLATLTPNGKGVPSLVSAVAQTPVRGSWWGLPEGTLIYTLAEELEHSGEVLTLKLVGGKVTFVHCALWPALLRALADPARQKQARAALPKPALALHDAVVERGRLRLDLLGEPDAPKATRALKGKPLKAAQEALEAAMLVVSRSEHTELGKHATALQSWRAWASPTMRQEAKALTLAQARPLLEAHGVELEAKRAQKTRRPAKKAGRRHSGKR